MMTLIGGCNFVSERINRTFNLLKNVDGCNLNICFPVPWAEIFSDTKIGRFLTQEIDKLYFQIQWVVVIFLADSKEEEMR